jgi:hypothetical protein
MNLIKINSKKFYFFEESLNKSKIIPHKVNMKNINFLKFERKNIYNKKNDNDDICIIFLKINR